MGLVEHSLSTAWPQHNKQKQHITIPQSADESSGPTNSDAQTRHSIDSLAETGIGNLDVEV